ncbi:CHAD domain-containing protein [Consotaella aegiceratis]|uniref:CHAD domain-containing protein n=1 Tax=Consotaella aegiceratis TaxID=3097961 RepID=UPI002F411A2D
MSSSIRPAKRLDTEIRRIAAAQLDKAIADLAAPAGPAREEGIHEARKRLKKLRGLIRLVRAGHEAFYAAENARYRDAARRLSGVRDRTALIEALDALDRRFPKADAAAAFAAVRTELERRRDRAADDDMADAIEATVRELKIARRQFDGFVLEHPRGEAGALLAAGFADTHARGRKALAAARRSLGVDDLHDLRKQAKYQSMHYRFLRDLWPELLQPLQKIAFTLADELGSDHDYAVLRGEIEAEPDRFGARREREAILVLMDRRQAELRASALAAADRLFAEKPGAMKRRIRHLWDLANDGG